MGIGRVKADEENFKKIVFNLTRKILLKTGGEVVKGVQGAAFKEKILSLFFNVLNFQ